MDEREARREEAASGSAPISTRQLLALAASPWATAVCSPGVRGTPLMHTRAMAAAIPAARRNPPQPRLIAITTLGRRPSPSASARQAGRSATAYAIAQHPGRYTSACVIARAIDSQIQMQPE
nr:unnamed protein product [Digitaria exilis]